MYWVYSKDYSKENMIHNTIDKATDENLVKILNINGEAQDYLVQHDYYIEHICKGGFRFISSAEFELEDRINVQLCFPDGSKQEVLGRICYNDAIDDNRTAYGFSIIEGFYSQDKVPGNNKSHDTNSNRYSL